MNDNDTKVLEPVGKSVYVYQLPIRIWHWTMVACVSVLIVTGYIIGKPWHSVTGQPYDTFYMGYTRMAHFIAGFTLVISTVLRYLYALIGNKYSRELLILPVWRKSWWGGLWSDVRWYLFLDKEPRAYVGHNPLAQPAPAGHAFAGDLRHRARVHGDPRGNHGQDHPGFRHVQRLQGASSALTPTIQNPPTTGRFHAVTRGNRPETR